ncbi:MAG: nitroreductase/quinone reductase family protein [Nitrososphaerales archaeon]
MKLNIQEKSFIANLTTIGRKTGKLHMVPLRLVFYNNKFYASRRNMNGDWLKNVLQNPSVIVELNGKEIKGKATLVEDKPVSKLISSIKYNDGRASLERVLIEITPEE